MPVQARFTFVPLAILAFCLAFGGRAAPAAPQSSSTQTPAKTKPVPPPEARVDINHASAEELAKVPGLTPSWAGRIVRFRPYRTKQDLLDHGVLPSDVYDRIKDYIIAHRDEQ
ncbi:MAG: helix-hairpin-helix domain-containing protein [Terracidiphilus sp.]